MPPHCSGVLAGQDHRDATSLDAPVPDYTDGIDAGVDGLRVGVLAEAFGEGVEPDVASSVRAAVDRLANAGAQVGEASLPHAEHALSAYYLIAPSEASSNLARYDGVRYGLRVEGDDSIEMMFRTRGAGFGPEVKRRIMLGTYALSAGYYDAYYGQAQKVRTLVIRDYEAAFADLRRADLADLAHHRVPDRGEGGRPAGDVPERHLHDPGEPGRCASHQRAVRAGFSRAPGRAADHRPRARRADAAPCCPRPGGGARARPAPAADRCGLSRSRAAPPADTIRATETTMSAPAAIVTASMCSSSKSQPTMTAPTGVT